MEGPMSVWIGRNEIELGTEGTLSVSWDLAADDDEVSVSGFSSLMFEDCKDDVEEDGTDGVEEDGTLDMEEDGVEDGEKEGREDVEEDVREYLKKDVVVESLFEGDSV